MSVSPQPRPRAFVVGLVLAGLGGFGLLGSFVFLLVGGVFSAVFPAVFGTPFSDLDLDREAARAPGQLLGVYPNPGLTVGNESTVRLVYRFDPGSGPREDEVVVVASHEMARLEPGAAVTVEYVAATPDVSRLAGTRVAIAGWAGALGLGFGVLGVVLVAVTGLLFAIGLVVALRAHLRSRR